MPSIAALRSVVLDCPDPGALADFYRQLVGGEIVQAEHDWVKLRVADGVHLAFQGVPDHRPPTWPGTERPQQLHVDVTVTDVDDAERRVVALGATRHEVQPGEAEGGNFRVFLDPAGHPFCLCWD